MNLEIEYNNRIRILHKTEREAISAALRKSNFGYKNVTVTETTEGFVLSYDLKEPKKFTGKEEN